MNTISADDGTKASSTAYPRTRDIQIILNIVLSELG